MFNLWKFVISIFIINNCIILFLMGNWYRNISIYINELGSECWELVLFKFIF